MTALVRRALGAAWLATDRRFQLLQRSLHVDREHYGRIVDDRIAAVVQHAYRNAPGWRERLSAAGIDDTSDTGRAELRRLRPLERVELQRHASALTSLDLDRRRWYRNSSGGSTGEPVTVIQDIEYLRWARATKALFDTWSGYRPGMPKMVLWGAPRDVDGGAKLRRRLLRWLKNERWVDAYRIDDATVHAWTERLEGTRPAQLLGYAESLDLWARILQGAGRDLAGPGAVMATAGVLTPQMRASLTEGFNAPVFDRYGCREVGDIAAETPLHDGLVIPPWHVHVEVLDPDGHEVGPGEEGEIVVTSLTNYAMPLLRYRIGDRATWAIEPPTARHRTSGQAEPEAWPRLERVVGRTTDHLMTRDGRYVHAGAIRTALYGIEGVRAYQVEQNTLDHVFLRLVTGPEAVREAVEEGARTRLHDVMKELLGHSIQVTVQIVDSIPTTTTGKHRHAMCTVER